MAVELTSRRHVVEEVAANPAEAIKANWMAAKVLGIDQSASITYVKPSGNVRRYKGQRAVGW